MNLHKIVRAAITRVNPDEENTLTQSIGVQNVNGLITNLTSAQEVKAQWQPITNVLEHTDGVDVTKIEMKVYLFSDDALPVAGIRRLPQMRAGDMLTRADGTNWLITSVLENWSPVGWAAVTAVMQTSDAEPDNPTMYYTFTIPETEHQEIRVVCGGRTYTSTFMAEEGAEWMAYVTVDDGFTVGTLSETSGVISGAVTLTITDAVLTGAYHEYDAGTGVQRWTWVPDVERGANGPTILNIGDTKYVITGNGTSGACGYRYLSTGTYFVIEDFYTGTTAEQWAPGGDIYEYLNNCNFKCYPQNDPGNYMMWKAGEPFIYSPETNGSCNWQSMSGATVADGKTVSAVREIINAAFVNKEPIVYELY